MTRIKTLHIVEPNDPVLTRKAEVVALPELFSDEISNIIETMFFIARDQQSERGRPVMVGLAAPQIGISKRIILVDLKADGHGNAGDLRFYINPEIIWHSEEKVNWYEGCYSTSRVCGIVSRPSEIKIRALVIDRKKNPEKMLEVLEETYSGYTARIFQHEIDHLDGKEFTTHIRDPENLHWVEAEEFPQYRDNEGWRNWPKKCSFEDWEAIKNLGKLIVRK